VTDPADASTGAGGIHFDGVSAEDMAEVIAASEAEAPARW
jgi:hypothetical protein